MEWLQFLKEMINPKTPKPQNPKTPSIKFNIETTFLNMLNFAFSIAYCLHILIEFQSFRKHFW